MLKNGNEYSEIICEECGSKQGGKNSASEFVAYNSAWSRIILASGIGINICEECIGGFVCADDSLAAQAELAKLIAMSLIHDYFSTQYDVKYAFSKTILNVFGDPAMKKLLEEKIFKLGGHVPQFDPDSVHLGINMSEDLDAVDRLNVENRIKKTWSKIYMSQCLNVMNNSNLPFSYTRKLHVTFYKPSMTSGLAATTTNGKDLAKLSNFEKKLIRGYFDLRKNSTVILPYLFLGLEPGVDI